MTDAFVRVSEFCQPDQSVVDSALLVAQHVKLLTDAHARIVISMAGVPGASSSFYNVLLGELIDALGDEEFAARIEFADLGKIQVRVFERSLKAIKGA